MQLEFWIIKVWSYKMLTIWSILPMIKTQKEVEIISFNLNVKFENDQR